MTAVGNLVAGRYRVVRPLAAGGISRVWLAADELLRRPVAIKQCALPAGLDAGEQDLLREWTLREAKAFARVEHDNVVRILDVVSGADLPWLVMEYVPSRSLLQVVGASGPLPPARVAAIGLAVLDGLEAIGRAGVLHLDVKPGNVLIADDGRVVLGDFGPVVTEQGIGALSGAGIILGSPDYIAPERLFDGVSTARADLWSLGATLYHAVEGRPPFARATVDDTLRAIDTERPHPARLAGPLAGVLDGLLRRDPAARLPAAEVRELLRAVTAEPEPGPAPASPPAARPAVHPVEPVRPRPLRRRRAAVLAAVAAAAVALAAASTGPPRDEVGSWAGTAGLAGGAVASVAPPALPAGYTWWPVTGGYRVAAPGDWRRVPAAGEALRLTAPGGTPALRIGVWSPSDGDVVAALTAEEPDTGLAGYRRIRIEPLAGPSGGLWEYTYTDPVAGPMRVLEEVTTGAGHAYRIEWRAPPAQWAAGLPVRAAVLDSFGPQPGG